MPLRIGTDMPTLDGATEWLNGDSIAHESLLGHPTLIHFWSVSCYLCKDNLPTLKKWEETYGPEGLQIVAVHMPRNESDTDVDKVKSAIAEFGIHEVCAVDNDHEIGERFETGGLWPYYFLFDADGKMKTRSAGNAGLSTIETGLKRLLETPEPVAA